MEKSVKDFNGRCIKVLRMNREKKLLRNDFKQMLRRHRIIDSVIS